MMIRTRSIACVAASLLTAAGAASAELDLGIVPHDVWAYAHAVDPGGDPVIRIWGNDGEDLNPLGFPGPGQSSFFYSHGFLSFDLDQVPPGYEWNGATLTLTVAPDSTYNPATADVYVRLITEGFDEETYVFGLGPKPISGDQNRLTGDDSQAADGAGSTITFEIPRDIPRNVLRRWAQTGRMDLCISADCDFDDNAEALRIASNNNLLYDGPRLVLR